MSIYTELVLNCELDGSIAQAELDAIRWWLGDIEESAYYPSGDILHDPAVAFLDYAALRSDYEVFPGMAQSSLVRCLPDVYCLTILVNCRNNMGQLESFLRWLAPRSPTRGFVGYLKSEAWSDPKLIYFETKAFLVEVSPQNRMEVTTYLEGKNSLPEQSEPDSPS